MSYQKSKCIYEGKVSKLYEATDESGVTSPEYLIIERKDHITKLDGEVRDSIEGKGACTNRISNALFRLLEQHDIATHFVEELSPTETLILRTQPLQLEVIMRNIATGSLCKRLPFENGTVLERPILELDLKDDERHDPLINGDHALALGLVRDLDELCDLEETTYLVNEALRDFFREHDITLVDFKLEFGRTPTGELVVIDEISPDTCRLWDLKTGKPLDKDIFRKGYGNDATLAAYQEVFDRLVGEA